MRALARRVRARLPRRPRPACPPAARRRRAWRPVDAARSIRARAHRRRHSAPDEHMLHLLTSPAAPDAAAAPRYSRCCL